MYASKGPIVEEWVDRHFFRPLGWRVAQRLLPTPVSADAVTFVSLVLGVWAGHLLWYQSAATNAAGVGLFVVSDIFDSADGQLARLRGTSSRLGRVLDGLADSARFISLYAHLGARLVVSGWGFGGAVLVFAALVSHSYQAAAVDFIRQSYLHFAIGDGSELDLPGETSLHGRSLWSRIGAWFYGDYVRRQALLFPRTTALARALAGGGTVAPVSLRRSWAERQRWVVSGCAWIAQNIRFLLLAITVVPGYPAAYCWVVCGPLNLLMVLLIFAHEREPKFHAQHA